MTRWEHEAVLERAQARLDRSPDAMRIRRATVEHPFGTLKAWMGSTHFLTKRLDRVSTEMSLHVLAYNMKRMINIMGTRLLVQPDDVAEGEYRVITQPRSKANPFS